MIETLSFSIRASLKIISWWLGLAIASFILAGCATPRIAPIADIENTPGAFSVPYTLSSSGRIVLNVSINEAEARPLALDTGATVSVLYGSFAEAVDLEVSDRTLFVRGLGQGRASRYRRCASAIGPESH